VSSGERERLEANFTKDELFEALNSMQNGKSLGMDGLPCEFYKTMWDAIGDDFCHVVDEVFMTGRMSQFLNQGLIKLININAARDTIGGWRPITLLSVAYKIMAKAMARKIHSVAKNVVRQEQVGFVQGRFILDTVISAWEGLEWAQGTGQETYFLKIDFDKAYDRVDWLFILEMLTCLGLGPRCVAMVNTLFSNASALALVNNSFSLRISLHRSSHQGCPLAPYLYVLAADALGYLLEVARIQGQVKGIRLTDNSEMVNNHFVDDSLLSVNAEQGSVEGAISCLNTFCTASDSVVNNHKTKYWLVGRDSPHTSGLEL